MGNLFALILTGCFCIWCSYEYGALNRPEVHIVQHASKKVILWRDGQSAVLADVYGLSAEEVDKPIRIFTPN